MGDKSPKANQKKKSQKESKDAAVQKRKDQVTFDKKKKF